VILDQLCELNGWHRDHARKALRGCGAARASLAGQAGPPATQKAREPLLTYGPEVIEALVKVWAVLDGPTGKRLAPVMGDLVASLRQHGELDVPDALADQLGRMSAATIDRRLADIRRDATLGKGRSLTKPGSLLKSQIPMRTWADWDDKRPGFLEIDLVGHDGGDLNGEHCFTLTATDIATGWTETRTVRNKAAKWVFAALVELQAQFPFPILGIDSDNGSEFINQHLLNWCHDNRITFTRSRPNNSNDGCHVEQKNWTIVRRTVGYWRYETPREMAILNQIWTALAPLTTCSPRSRSCSPRPGRQGHQDLRHRPDPLPTTPDPPRRPGRHRRQTPGKTLPGPQPRPGPSRRRRPPEVPARHRRPQETPPAAANRTRSLAGKIG